MSAAVATPGPASHTGNEREQRWRRDVRKTPETGPTPTQGYAAAADAEPLEAPVPLSDQQVQQFIVEGFLEIPRERSRAQHDAIFDKAYALGPRAEELGNNVLPALPELLRVYEAPRVRGAVESLVGPGYLLHPHRYCHTSERPAPQTWHRDSFWGHWHPRNACPYWIMALYFPQDTPIELGPTEILPRSQWYNKDEGNSRGPYGCSRFADAESGVPATAWRLRPRPLTCAAGTVVLIHYDLWHRGGANISGAGIRFMFKFQFSRMVSPALAPRASAAPAAERVDWQAFAEEGVDTVALEPVWQGVWDWLHGRCTAVSAKMDHLLHVVDENPREVADAKAELRSLLRDPGQDASDPARVAAAWTLASLCRGQPGLVEKVVAVLDELCQLRGRSAMHLLDLLGPEAVPALLRTPGLRQSSDAVHGLGRCLDMSPGAPEERDSLDVLSEILKDGKDPLLRVCAAEALGCYRAQDAAWPLQLAVAGDAVGAVRATALHALLRLLTSGALGCDRDGCLKALLRTAEAVKPKDPDRYVRAYAAELCHRIGIVQQLTWQDPGADEATVAEKSREARAMPPLVRWCTCGDGWHANA